MPACLQRPYDIHSSNAVESLVQLFSTVSVQYLPTWSKEMVALLRKVSLPLYPPVGLYCSCSFSSSLGLHPPFQDRQLYLGGSDPFTRAMLESSPASSTDTLHSGRGCLALTFVCIEV